MKLMLDGSRVGLNWLAPGPIVIPAGMMASQPPPVYCVAVRLPTTAIASPGIAESPEPVPLIWTTVKLPLPFFAPDRVSRRRNGLYGAVARVLSTRTVLTRRHTPTELWIHSTPLESRTCSKLFGV